MIGLDPIDRGPYDRELWIRCSVCGQTFDDDRDFLEHQAEADE